jgi:hypothetical protein
VRKQRAIGQADFQALVEKLSPALLNCPDKILHLWEQEVSGQIFAVPQCDPQVLRINQRDEVSPLQVNG